MYIFLVLHRFHAHNNMLAPQPDTTARNYSCHHVIGEPEYLFSELFFPTEPGFGSSTLMFTGCVFLHLKSFN